MAAERIKCCVPFCRRTAAQEKHPGCTEIMCGKHYRIVPKETRERYTQLRRRLRMIERRIMIAEGNGLRNTKPWHKLVMMAHRAFADVNEHWARIKREAIERAAGLC